MRYLDVFRAISPRMRNYLPENQNLSLDLYDYVIRTDDGTRLRAFYMERHRAISHREALRAYFPGHRIRSGTVHDHTHSVNRCNCVDGRQSTLYFRVSPA